MSLVFTTPPAYSIFENSGTLPNDLITCVTTGQGTAPCDKTMGSIASGGGYCATTPYSTMTYCACVNNTLPCATVTSQYCSNDPYSYKPSYASPSCANANLCVNAVDTGSGIVDGVTQVCGASNMMINSNYLLILIVIVIIYAFIKLYMTSRKTKVSS